MLYGPQKPVMLSSRFLPFDYTWFGLEVMQTRAESGIKIGRETLQPNETRLASVTHSRLPRARRWCRRRAGKARGISGGCPARGSQHGAAESAWKMYSIRPRVCQRVRSFWKEFYLFRKYFWKYLHVKITCLNSLTKQALGHMQNF